MVEEERSGRLRFSRPIGSAVEGFPRRTPPGMGEVELVEGGLSGQAREFEATLDGAAVPSFQLQIGQALQGGRKVKIAARGLSGHRLQILSHGRQGQMAQFLFQVHRRIPFEISR
jgi:hypothetical protein